MVAPEDKKMLILVRHGLALDKQVAVEDGITDFDRMLKPKGMTRTKKLAKKLGRFFNSGDAIKVITSPSLRCQETAQILCQKLKKLELEVSLFEDMKLEAHQAPGAFDRSMNLHIKEWSMRTQRPHLMIVGHEPQLSQWLSTLFVNAGRVMPVEPYEVPLQSEFIKWPKSGYAVIEWSFEETKGALIAFGR